MLKAIETTGKNEEEAISAALRELGKGRDEVSVEILERSKSGFLGIGAVPARVRVSYEYVESNAEKAEVFLKGLLERLGSDAVPVVESGVDEKGEECLSVNLTGEKLGMLIGRRGETLDALQYLTSLNINRGREEYLRVSIDTENYRAKREEALRKLAVRMAGRAKKSGRRVALEPMNPYERRILHSALQNDPDVTTHSEGEEPYRRVIITLK